MIRVEETELMRHGATRPIQPCVHMPGWIHYGFGARPISGWPDGRDVFVAEVIDEETLLVRATNGDMVVMLRQHVDLGEEVFLGGTWYPEYSYVALAHFANLHRFPERRRVGQK